MSNIIPSAEMLQGSHGWYLCFRDDTRVYVRIAVDQHDGDVITDVLHSGAGWQAIAMLQILCWEAGLEPKVFARDADRNAAWGRLIKHKKYTGLCLEFYSESDAEWYVTCSSPRYFA